MRIFLYVGFLCFFSQAAEAQLQKKIHQTWFADSLQLVQLDIAYPVQIQTWPGFNVMTETVLNISPEHKHILLHFAEQGRFQLEEERNGTEVLSIKSTSASRKPLILKDGTHLPEDVTVFIYVPESFDITDPTKLRRKHEGDILTARGGADSTQQSAPVKPRKKKPKS
jgi:hypothetical protein